MTRYLITSALPYINGVKHLGNLVGSLLPADVFARFCRARGFETLALCATDEHGSTTELAAAEAGMDVRRFCDQQYALQKAAGEGFGLSWDHFGRSSNAPNIALTQHFARLLWKNGHLEVRTTKQVYSNADKRFLSDRYVIGTCPHCGYERARGDQCENCTRVLDPVDLINPRSAISGSPDIEIRDSTHLFLKQSNFVPQLREWIGGHERDWPVLVTSIARKWLDEGLHDRGITRDVEWGVPVPDDIADGQLGGKVFYVWFDAPIEYIGCAQEWAEANGKSEAWRDWWIGPKSKDVVYCEFMGKDNIPFHTVGFPVTIMGARPQEDWKLVDRLKGFNYINFDGGKFSTSQKRGVFMDQALEILPADYWRYYLMANAPESSDSNFTWEHFAGQVNKDLADVLGNFVNRVTKFCVARFEGRVPEGGVSDELDYMNLIAPIWLHGSSVTTSFEELEFRAAMRAIRALLVTANEYVTKAAPWTLFKSDPLAAGRIINVCLNVCHLIARFCWPIIPQTSDKIFRALNVAPDHTWPIRGAFELNPSSGHAIGLGISGWSGQLGHQFELVRPLLSQLQAGHEIGTPEILFAKITEEQIEDWKARFGGGG